jgi:hypothetical protein
MERVRGCRMKSYDDTPAGSKKGFVAVNEIFADRDKTLPRRRLAARWLWTSEARFSLALARQTLPNAASLRGSPVDKLSRAASTALLVLARRLGVAIRRVRVISSSGGVGDD